MYIAQVKRFLFWKTLYEEMGFEIFVGYRVSKFVYFYDAKNLIQSYFYKMKKKREKKKKIVVYKGKIDI